MGLSPSFRLEGRGRVSAEPALIIGILIENPNGKPQSQSLRPFPSGSTASSGATPAPSRARREMPVSSPTVLRLVSVHRCVLQHQVRDLLRGVPALRIFELIFVYGNAMGAPTFIPLTSPVAPGATAPLIATHAGLPPVLVSGAEGHHYELQLGDLRVTLYDGPAVDGNEVAQAWASVTANVDLDVAVDGTLRVIVSSPQLAVDVTLLSDPNGDPTQAEALFEALVPPLLGDLGSAFGGVALPSISGFSLQNTTVHGDGGFLVVEGELNSP